MATVMSCLTTCASRQRIHATPDRLEPPVEQHFVGRTQEMAVLHASLRAACAGQGRIVLLAGEPGIGKTRTVRELATQAERYGAHVLLGSCETEEGAPPFGPWVQVLRLYVAHHTSEVLRADMGDNAAVIAQVVTAVRERLPTLPPPPALPPEQTRFRFFDAVTTFLNTASRRQPLVLILDDLHRADTASLLLLQFLARALLTMPLLVVGTYRDRAPDGQQTLTAMLGALVRLPGYERLMLHGLSQCEVGHFIEQTARVRPAACA